MRKFSAWLILAFILSACAPAAVPVTPEYSEAERIAALAWHRMEAHYLETGGYATAVLINLPLPPGIGWSLEDFGETRYLLKVTASAVPDVAWYVSPEGVRRGLA